MTAQGHANKENLGIIVTSDGVRSALHGPEDEPEFRFRPLNRDNAHDVGDIVSSMIGITRIRAATKHADLGRVVIACMTPEQQDQANQVLTAQGIKDQRFVPVDEAMWRFARTLEQVRGAATVALVMVTDDGCQSALYDGYTGTRLAAKFDPQLTLAGVDEHIRDIVAEKAPGVRIGVAKATMLRKQLADQDTATLTKGSATIEITRSDVDGIVADQTSLAVSHIEALCEKAQVEPDVLCVFGGGMFFDALVRRTSEHPTCSVVVPPDHENAAALGALNFYQQWYPPTRPQPSQPPLDEAAPAPELDDSLVIDDRRASAKPKPSSPAEPVDVSPDPDVLPAEAPRCGGQVGSKYVAPVASNPRVHATQLAEPSVVADDQLEHSSEVRPARSARPDTSTHPLAAGKKVVEIKTAARSPRKRRRKRRRSKRAVSASAIAMTGLLGLGAGFVVVVLWLLLLA
ncbi:hypothetical protein IEU95_03530 [Hoyosella rhizosphaerae]|uniref:Uncharacterized protein n=1 Tax=Hoyosella rhizosphaerae TaxID=1755582 RepID=A0A916UBQ4_9ACTN|nr:hypothetical protein [Hoyosella rhizosphaerae]MBN4925886.1 hypothetical protein [Hoyosella rhizosphaerae]GGC67186.1 hypothetical protein GCM10011410_19820 [Hoyosella rhizosphaerae]